MLWKLQELWEFLVYLKCLLDEKYDSFGRAIKRTKAYSITIELLSVNKRNFEVVLSCPREYNPTRYKLVKKFLNQ